MRRAPRQGRSRQTVDAVLAAVPRVIRREGVDAVTTNRIAEAAGVSIGSLYQYFPDKKAIFSALQATEVETFPMVTSSGTVLGTTRMGDDRRQSVVDRDLRAHDHSNLFIVGGMVFPTAGVNPPTLTIAALALRASAQIKQDLAQMP